MIFTDIQLLFAAVLGIVLSIVLIVRGRLHPFIALLCGAFVIGPLAGLSLTDTAKAVQKGTGDVLGGIGLVVALGLALGTMLQLSDGAAGLARVMIGRAERRRAPWMCLLVALVIGLPLFFETGLVLLLPIVASAAMPLSQTKNQDAIKLRLMLSAVTGLSVLHALVPPHPGPLLAVATLNADLGRTIIYGVLVAIPTAIVAGPLLSLITARNVKLAPLQPIAVPSSDYRVSTWRALIVVLLPVVLIAAGQVRPFLPPALAPHLAWLSFASNPVLALLLACLAALPMLFGRRMAEAPLQKAIWLETMKPAGAILLAIGAGGLGDRLGVGVLQPRQRSWFLVGEGLSRHRHSGHLPYLVRVGNGYIRRQIRTGLCAKPLPLAGGYRDVAGSTDTWSWPMSGPRLADQAYSGIIELIATRQMSVGDRLPSEIQLAEMFGMSRTIVREALVRLASDGITEARRGAGSFVKNRPSDRLIAYVPTTGLSAMLGTYEVRFVLEAEAARLAAIRRSTQDLLRIEDALAKLRGALLSRDCTGDSERRLSRGL